MHRPRRARGAPLDFPGHRDVRLVVEGNIGSGKTTVMNALADKGYSCYPEPVGSWEGLLIKASQNPETYSADLQRCILLAMAKRNEEAFDATIGGGVKIFERDIISAIPFIHCAGEKHHISHDEQRALIQQVTTAAQTPESTASLVVFLEAPAQVCLARIRRRNRKGEERLHAPYLKDLGEKMKESLTACCRGEVPWRIVDASRNVDEVCDAVVQELFSFLGAPGLKNAGSAEACRTGGTHVHMVATCGTDGVGEETGSGCSGIGDPGAGELGLQALLDDAGSTCHPLTTAGPVDVSSQANEIINLRTRPMLPYFRNGTATVARVAAE